MHEFFLSMDCFKHNCDCVNMEIGHEVCFVISRYILHVSFILQIADLEFFQNVKMKALEKSPPAEVSHIRH